MSSNRVQFQGLMNFSNGGDMHNVFLDRECIGILVGTFNDDQGWKTWSLIQTTPAYEGLPEHVYGHVYRGTMFGLEAAKECLVDMILEAVA